MKLEGKRVLITGGSSGIGLAIAQALLARRAKVAITGRRPAVLSAAVEALRKNGGSVAGIVADVGTEEGRALTLQQALEALGGLDILVNNAGGVRAGRLEATSQKEIETMLNVDLVAPILLTRAALPALRERRRDGRECHVWHRADRRAVLRHICRRQGGSCSVW